MLVKSFEKCAAYSAIAAGASAFLYAVAFILISRNDPQTGALLSALFLLLTGLYVTTPLISIYHMVRGENPGYAMWALLLGSVAAIGMMIHGGYDLANAINPPLSNDPALASLPSQIDPRGLLSFGVGGLALFVNSWLLGMRKDFPKGLVMLGYISSFFLLVLYIGRLIILDPTHPLIAYSALINGFFVNPAWYIWLGLVLLKEKHTA